MTWTVKRLLVILGGLLALLLVAAWKPPEREAPLPDLSAYPWLYLRAGRPLTDAEPLVELVIVGDVMLGRGVAGQPNPLAEVAPWLRDADLALGNLEGVITEVTPLPPERSDGRSSYRLSMPSSAVMTLENAGFDILGLANNHALDFGHQGLADTIVHLETAGIDPLGVTSGNVPAAWVPLVREVNGVRLGFLAFNVVPYAMESDSETIGGWAVVDWDQEQAVASIAGAHTQADAVVVFIHWGYEYETRPDPFQRNAAQAMLAAGADLVVGHHPHVVQDAERRDDGFVAYSLGNFVFDQQAGETGQGLAMRTFFDEQGLRAVQALPIWAGPRPHLMPLAQAGLLLDRLGVPARRVGLACSESATKPCYPFGEAGTNPEEFEDSLGQNAEAVCCPESDRAVSGTYAKAMAGDQACFPVDVPWVATAGGFEAGQIDLTGDGRAERVRLMGDQVAIYASDGEMPFTCEGELWRSPPDWQVVDVALGDPDADGRGEIVLALWKPGPGEDTGTGEAEILRPWHNQGLRSHPLIIGYREGVFRTLWGGSAVGRPLREIDLGDVDRDGMQELIVLEEDGLAGDRTVSVWRWHGWGFSLVHRSPPGCYHDLLLMPGQDGWPALISVAE